MSISRILAVATIVALLVVAGLALYNAANTNAVGAAMERAYGEQRKGEWSAGQDPLSAALDQHDRHVPDLGGAYYQQRVGERNAGEE